MLSAVGFGILGAVPEPDLTTVLLLGIVAVTIGIWSRGVRVGLWGLVVLVFASAARALWVDGYWIYLPEELPSALLRAGLPWLAAVALRQYISLGRQADQEREMKRRERAAELERRFAAERLHLAQSLHDDLGHSLSLVALTVGRLELDSSLPDSSRVALSNARQQVAQAVERLGDSVVSLRAGKPLGPPDNGGDTHPEGSRRRGTPRRHQAPGGVSPQHVWARPRPTRRQGIDHQRDSLCTERNDHCSRNGYR